MKEINTLIFSGGSSKGITYVGVFKKLEELIKERLYLINKGIDIEDIHIPIINIKRITSVSVGSIFGLIYTVGYDYKDMLEEVLTKNFDSLRSVKIMNFVSKYGLDNGENIVNWLKSMIRKKGYDSEINFIDLYEKTKIDLQIIATNLNKYCYKKFNYIETPYMKVVDAVRMSISIPFLFTVNEYEGDIYVDGALIDNYPIKLYENENLDNILGFKLINHGEMEFHNVNARIDDIESYIYHVLSCYIVQKEKHTTRIDKFKNCTVYIHTENVTDSLNFSLTAVEKNTLIEIGYKYTDKYFKSFK